MQQIIPFLWFDTQAEEAANFYISVFKNSRILETQRYGDTGPGPKGSVMVVSFELNGQKFSAINGGPVFKFNESISFVIDCNDQAEVDYFWNKLTADGGAESMCGWLKDKYGLSWQVVPKQLSEALGDKDPKRAERAMRAMMTMKKIDIRKIQDAADGK